MGKYDVVEDILSPEVTGQEFEKLATVEPGKYDIEYDTRTGEPKKTEAETLSLSGGIAEAFTGEKRKTPLTESLPEFIKTEELRDMTPHGLKKQVKLSAGLIASMDQEDQMDIIEENVPGVKFFKDEKENVIVDVGGKKSVLNKPGASYQDSINVIGQVLAYLPASRIAGISRTVLGKIGLGGLLSGFTEAGLQETEIGAGAKKERDLGRITSATIMGGLGEGVGPAYSKLKKLRAAKKLGSSVEELPDIAKSVSSAGKATEATGIELAVPQKTLVPYQLEEQAYISQLSAGTKAAIKFLKKQNKQSADAVEDFMNLIAPEDALITGPSRARTAAQRAIKVKENIRAEKTSPLYAAAKANKEPVDMSSLTDYILERVDKYPKKGDIRKALWKAEGLIDDNPTIELLHGTKVEIDEMLNAFGDRGLGKGAKKEILEVKNRLLELMEAKSPEYRKARLKFIEESPPVTKIQESIIGKVANLDDTQLKTLSKKILDPEETNAMVVRQAKMAIKEMDPGAWDAIVRTEMERRIGTVRTTLENMGTISATENVPAQLHSALFGNTKQRRVFFASLDGDMKKNAEYLESALRRARMGRPGGSQTAIRKDIEKRLRGGFALGLRDIFRAPVSKLVSAGESGAFDARVKSVAKAFFDPEYIPEMGKIRKMSPNSAVAVKAFSQLINNIESNEQ